MLHHIPEPEPVVRRVFAALRPGGKFVFWVYGKEGNEAYLAWLLPLRQLTARLPDVVLRGICHLLNVALALYIALCRYLPLPLRAYMNEVIGHFSWRKRFLVIFHLRLLFPPSCLLQYFLQIVCHELTLLLIRGDHIQRFLRIIHQVI